MSLDRLWRNGPIGFQPVEAGDDDAAARFAARAHRHTVRLSLRIAAAALLLATAMWLTIILLGHHEQEAALTRARIEGANLSAALSEEVGRSLDMIDRAMLLFAEQARRSPTDLDIDQFQAQIASLARPTIQSGMIGADGKLRSTSLLNHAEPVDLSDREHFRVHLDGTHPGLFISKPILGRISQRTTIQLTRRVDAADGKFLGVVVFSLPPEELISLHRSLDLGAHGVIALTGTDGIVRARIHPGQDAGMVASGESVARSPWRDDLLPGEARSYMHESVIDHVTRLYSMRRMEKYPLLVMVGLDVEDVLAVPRTHAWLTSGIGAAITALLGGLTVLLLRELWRRTHREVQLAAEQVQLEAANAALSEESSKLAAANQALEASSERAEAANRAKSRFLAHMSHELRTPLHAIIGFAEILKDQRTQPQNNAATADYASQIWTAGRTLLEIINAILDVSRVEAGTAQLAEATVGVADVVRAAAAAVRSQAQARRVALELELPNDLPAVRADAGKLRQIVANLLRNAVAFSPPGGEVTVSVRQLCDGGLAITVEDGGIGMSDAEIAVALEPFSQLENVLSRSTGGPGIGLPLAIGLAELHGGSLRIHSCKGSGTRVEVRLPPQRVIRPARRTAAESGGQPCEEPAVLSKEHQGESPQPQQAAGSTAQRAAD